MPSLFIRAADKLDDLAVLFQGHAMGGTPVSPDQCAAIAAGLKDLVLAIRVGERQRIAALNLAGNPVGDGLTVVLQPFAVVQGGRL